MFYRQFGDIDSAGHPLKDKEGNNIPSTARSYGNILTLYLCVYSSLSCCASLTLLTHHFQGGNRKNSFIGQAANGSFSGRSRQSFILRKSFGAAGMGGPPGTPPWGQDQPTHRSGKDFTLLKKGSFNVGNSSSRQKLVTRTSISTIGGSSLGGADTISVNGDITVRSGGLSHRGLTNTRSQSQIVSQVRVKSFQGGGPAPRLVKMIQTTSSVAGIARTRYLADHEDDVQGMQNFFRRAGLSMQKSIACAEEAICLDASSPRKLFKYVHEVTGFSLMNLGMDRIDAELVLEVLNNEFSHRDISAESAAASAVAKMMGGAGGAGNFKHSIATDTSQSWSNAPSTTTISMIERIRPEEGVKARRIAEHEDDVVDMQEFFRFAGLSVTLSRQCAENAISMDANSPRKLYKYLEEVKGFYLTDLGMDGLEADMVMKALRREFVGQSDKNVKPSTRKKQVRSPDAYEYDYKSDSSEDFEEKTESVSSSMHNMSRVSEAQEKGSVIPLPRQPVTSSSSSSKNSLVPMLKATRGSHVAPPRSSFSGHEAELLFKAKVRAALEHQNKGGPVSPAPQGTYDSGVHSLEISLALGNLPPKASFRGDEEQKDLNDFLTQNPATESTFTGLYYSSAIIASSIITATVNMTLVFTTPFPLLSRLHREEQTTDQREDIRRKHGHNVQLQPCYR